MEFHNLARLDQKAVVEHLPPELHPYTLAALYIN